MRMKFYALAVMIALSGCDSSLDEPVVPRQRLQTIVPFDPEPYRTPEEAEPEIFEPAREPAEKVWLNLPETRTIALKNNLGLKVQLLAPAIAQEAYNASRAFYEPSFHTAFYLSKTDRPVASALQAVEGASNEYISITPGVDIPLQTGGSLTFDLADSRAKGDTYIYSPSYGPRFTASVSQPLLRGAGLENNSGSWQIRLSQYDWAIADAQTRLEVISVIAAIDRVYWRLYAARQLLKVRVQQYELARVQLERARRFVRSGQDAQIEVYRAEAGLAQRLESIILAENELRERQRELKLALQDSGLEPGSLTSIVPVTEPNPLHYSFDPGRLVEQAIENRMEMLETELRLAKAVINEKYYRNQALPLVNLQYTYNINGLGPLRSDAYDLLLDKNFEDHTLGVEVVIPLGNQAAESRVRGAFLQRRQALASARQRRAMIEVEVLNAIDRLETNWQRILASRQSALLEERLYQAEIRQFEIGVSTSTDVLEAQANFANAQSAEISALTEYQISLVDLAYATGTLLGSANVEWQPPQVTPDD
jgi:outer membrane protein